jgi:probable F420-dependent oxidoreductase
MKVGVFLPTYMDAGSPEPEELRNFARNAESLGFDSLWATDHVVTAKRFYRVSWLDPLSALSHVAAVTERVRLGTSILILPLRQPALLAKEIATLQHLSGGRYILGAGVGWYGPEFEACGVHKTERGGRTDEVLEAVTALFRQDDVTYQRRYYRLDGVTVEPHPLSPPPVWVGGGRQLEHETSPEHVGMHPAVLARIVRADGWIARPTCPPELIRLDVEAIRAARADAGLVSRPFTLAHENFVWVKEGGRREQILAAQRDRYSRLMSDERPWGYIGAVYLTGSIEDIQEQVQARVDAGVSYLILHTLTADIEQLKLLARHVLEPFRNDGGAMAAAKATNAKG